MNIGNINIETPVLLAPMAGVTDIAFRRICRDAGAGLTYTEMVSARALLYQDRKSNELMRLDDGESPSAVQIFGCDPEIMAQAAAIVSERVSPDIIDINMGCPTPKIVSNGDGCALMRDLPLAERIISSVVRAVSVPVTVKFRKGWDNGCVNAVEFATMAEASGAACLCVHGRTRAAMYSGRADWDIIRDVVHAVKIPVIANGDIFSADDCVRAFKYTGAAAVMIGRAAFGNPWLFGQCSAALRGEAVPALPPLRDRLETAYLQIRTAAEYKGEHIAMLEARKHLAWYLRGVRGANYYKDKVCHLSSMEELSRLVREISDTLY
ncbi:MAG: tRNA dihydrouridine synthase DusB [Clostridia bacterium]